MALDSTVPFPSSPEVWQKFAAFEVFADHEPAPGGRVACRITLDPADLTALLAERAHRAPPLDPEVGGWVLRSGIALAKDPAVEAVYVAGEDAVVVLRADAAGPSTAHLSRLSGRFAGVFSVLAGRPTTVGGTVFEFPDASVLARAVGYFQESVEEQTPRRSAAWLGAQMIGRDEPFHPSMLDTLEEQTSLLEAADVSLHDLPAWWWRGTAAVRVGGGVELLEPPPPAAELLARAAG